MNRKYIEIALSLFFIGLSIALYGSVDTSSTAVSQASTDSSRTYVNALAISLGLAGVFELIASLLSKSSIIQFTKDPKRFAMLILSLVAYVWAMPYLGFVVSTLLFLVITMRAMGYENLPKSLVIALGITASVYLLFKVGFDIPLPEMSILEE